MRERIIKKVSKDQDLDPAIGKAIIDTLFKQLKEVASSANPEDDETFQNFRIINFGIFYSTERKRNNFKKRYVKKP